MSEFVTEISALLSQHGGWGLAAVFAYVIFKIYGKMEADRVKFVESLSAQQISFNEAMEVRHNEFITLLKETQDTLGSVGVIIQKCQGPKDG